METLKQLKLKEIIGKNYKLRYRDTPYCIRPIYYIIDENGKEIGDIDLRTFNSIIKKYNIHKINGYNFSDLLN
jgi:hypothetical protein